MMVAFEDHALGVEETCFFLCLFLFLFLYSFLCPLSFPFFRFCLLCHGRSQDQWLRRGRSHEPRQVPSFFSLIPNRRCRLHPCFRMLLQAPQGFLLHLHHLHSRFHANHLLLLLRSRTPHQSLPHRRTRLWMTWQQVQCPWCLVCDLHQTFEAKLVGPLHSQARLCTMLSLARVSILEFHFGSTSAIQQEVVECRS